MTDRIRQLTITLDRDYRSDDVEVVISALRMNRAVADVSPHVVQGSDHVARSVVRAELRGTLYDAIDHALDPDRTRKDRDR